jgi:hypothetical protein
MVQTHDGSTSVTVAEERRTRESEGVQRHPSIDVFQDEAAETSQALGMWFVVDGTGRRASRDLLGGFLELQEVARS